MEKITIKLSDTPNNTYGKPLGLLNGMIKTVEYNKEVRILLNAGVIEPVPTNKGINPQATLKSPVIAKKTVKPTKTTFKKKVASKRFI